MFIPNISTRALIRKPLPDQTLIRQRIADAQNLLQPYQSEFKIEVKTENTNFTSILPVAFQSLDNYSNEDDEFIQNLTLYKLRRILHLASLVSSLAGTSNG